MINKINFLFVTLFGIGKIKKIPGSIASLVTTLFLVGGEVIKYFAFALIIGVIIGTYSSIFVASPIMIYFENKAGQKLTNK